MKLDLEKNLAMQLTVGAKLEAEQIQLTYLPPDIPLEFSATFGDAVHNLHSALDFLAYAVSVEPIGNGNPKKVHFPAVKNEKDFRENYDERMGGAPCSVRSVIESLEPWNGGKYAISTLHDLDIRDKHKLLVSAIGEVSFSELRAKFRGDQISIKGTDFVRHEGTVTNFVATIDCPGIESANDFEIQHGYDPSLSMVFGVDRTSGRDLDANALLKIADAATKAIQNCDNLFHGQAVFNV